MRKLAARHCEVLFLELDGEPWDGVLRQGLLKICLGESLQAVNRVAQDEASFQPFKCEEILEENTINQVRQEIDGQPGMLRDQSE